MEQRDDIMTVEEVAKFLKLQPQTVYKWAQEGQIPGAKLGKEWRFRRHILEEWLDASIILSKGGFDFLIQSTNAQMRKSGISSEELQQIIRSASPSESGKF